ncbi:MAG: DUF5103 domain-containing protein [Ferruginibacter sp.]
MNFVRSCVFLFFLFVGSIAYSQQPDRIYQPYIKTAQLYQYGSQQSLPILQLNGSSRIELDFDDMEGSLKNYYYTYVLCDYNWTPLNINPFDYIKGFTQNRISTYRYSSIAYTRYTHYQAILPENNSTPSKSGNYLLKVFLDGDTSKTVFTKRMFVVDNKASISGAVIQPLNPNYYTTHQKLRFSISVKDLNSFSAAQQVKVVILQNNRPDNAEKDIPPTFTRGTTLEYNSENIGIFPGGKEWRWLDIRSFRLQSDRVDSAHYNKNTTDIFVKPDVDRRSQRYVYFADLDGTYQIATYESVNPFWQGDYATTYFTFLPPDGKPYEGYDLYMIGGFTDYQYTDQWKLQFNEARKLYELNTFLKQGYYNYAYMLVNKNDPTDKISLEGNYFETENMYTVLIYYKSFTDRADQLIGVGQFNSRSDRSTISF